MLTVADVLGLEVVARSAPKVVAGGGLAAPVRWVHINEMVWPGQITKTEQLILTCGLTLPSDDHEIDTLFAALASARVSGLVIMLGPRYVTMLPSELISAADRHGVPLVALELPAHLNEIAESVNLIIADERLEVLAAAEEVHHIFTELALEGASPWEVVHQIALFSRRPVVLENLAHQMLAYDSANDDPADLLAGWEEQSRQISHGTSDAEERGWLTAPVGARGKDWGRLLMLPAAEREPVSKGAAGAARSEISSLILKRGAETLALNQLIGASQEYVERQAHAALLRSILTHSLTAKEVALRSRAMGLPLENSQLLGVVVRQRRSNRPSRADVRCLEDVVVTALQGQRIRALTAALDNGVVAVLMTAKPQDDATSIIESFSRTLHGLAKECFGYLNPDSQKEPELIIAVGPSVSSIYDGRRSLTAALQALGVAMRSDHPISNRPYVRTQDMRLTGLLRLLRDDSRLQSYIENEIGPLLEYDARHGTRLTSVLACYLDVGRNKTAAAEAAQMSRPSLYDRLERIERILSVDLDDPRSCLSLQVATQALQVVRQQGAL
ncbi:PucR family transcriptional regulator ligand-binding domain-containing protein [Streptomyces sp. NPDC051133]|uniref:PucR family transcriptional regulator n=1 Tax=Streptomyces sp. NPDC051133 TaxID=3155521 RepID=UPI003445B27B